MATSIGMLAILRSGSGYSVFRQSPLVWLCGVAGLFGYHFFYFTALRLAPPVEAGLIAYLWPLLIILLSALLPQEKLKWHHVIGGVIGLSGAIVIVTRGGHVTFNPDHLAGYLSAALCALIWSSYSVLSRRMASVPSEMVTGFCAVSCLLAFIAHLGLENTVWPESAGQWLAVAGLGLGPVGLAFYVWDHGVKRGNIQVLGAASYAAPVLSTLALVAAGFAKPSWSIALATVLVTLGALVAARDLIGKRN